MNDSLEQFYIDKTAELQRGIKGFPFIYMEGVAACGKSTAVKMLIEKYPDAQEVWIDMEKENFLEQDAVRILERIHHGVKFVVFENMNRELSVEERKQMVLFLEKAWKDVYVIFISREQPDECLLPFLWQRKMEIIPQEALFFSKLEVQRMITEAGCSLRVSEVFKYTGGWPGCVDVILRLLKRFEKYNGEVPSVKELRQSYEVEEYIQRTIMSSLSNGEKYLLQRVGICPFVNEKLCEEVFGIKSSRQTLQKLRRKGIFKYDTNHECWKLAEAFQMYSKQMSTAEWKELAEWYVQENRIPEVLYCAKNVGDQTLYMDYLEKYYDRIELSCIQGELMLSKKKLSLKMCYLQGMYNYLQQDFYGLDCEIKRLERLDVTDEFKKQEILLNLYYVKPDFSLKQWLDMLKEYGEKHKAEEKKFRIYHILGYSYTYLCGLRDLTGLFACTRKEENQNARIWKSFLGEEEWKCYQLARMDYYLETDRQDKICEEDWGLLYEDGSISYEMNRVRLYLSGRLLKNNSTVEEEEHFTKLSNQIKGQQDDTNLINSIICFYSRWTKKAHLMTYWLRYSENLIHAELNERNYAEIFLVMKGYLQMKQFEKIERIIKKMIPYLQKYRHTRLLAEVLFQQAIISWETGRHGQAIQNVIESFLVGTPCRYVEFYTNYGVAGKEVLEAYEEWCRTNLPEKWNRKKKYQYGNVLRMPEAEYVSVVLRLAHKNRFAGSETSASLRKKNSAEMFPERLTMMETLVLQSISRGYSNAQICTELNLKLPTVKTHIYSLYKKLGVSGRVQAIYRGKELGIV